MTQHRPARRLTPGDYRFADYGARRSGPPYSDVSQHSRLMRMGGIQSAQGRVRAKPVFPKGCRSRPTRLIESNQVAHPAKDRSVGDGIFNHAILLRDPQDALNACEQSTSTITPNAIHSIGAGGTTDLRGALDGWTVSVECITRAAQLDGLSPTRQPRCDAARPLAGTASIAATLNPAATQPSRPTPPSAMTSAPTAAPVGLPR
jgi:hypothetical protein